MIEDNNPPFRLEYNLPTVLIPQVNDDRVARLNHGGQTLARVDLQVVRNMGFDAAQFTRVLAVSSQIVLYWRVQLDSMVHIGFDGLPYLNESAALQNYIENASTK